MLQGGCSPIVLSSSAVHAMPCMPLAFALCGHVPSAADRAAAVVSSEANGLIGVEFEPAAVAVWDVSAHINESPGQWLHLAEFPV